MSIVAKVLHDLSKRKKIVDSDNDTSCFDLLSKDVGSYCSYLLPSKNLNKKFFVFLILFFLMMFSIFFEKKTTHMIFSEAILPQWNDRAHIFEIPYEYSHVFLEPAPSLLTSNPNQAFEKNLAQEKTFHKTIFSRNPPDVSSQNTKANLSLSDIEKLWGNQNFSLAIEKILEAQKNKNSHPKIKLWLARSYLGNQQPEKALSLLESTPENFFQEERDALMAACFDALHQSDRAEEYYHRLASRFPEHPKWLLAWAAHLEEKGRTLTALELYRKAAQSPELSEPLRMHAYQALSRLEGQVEEAD